MQNISAILGHSAIIDNLHIRARVVVISDGNPTDLDMSGPTDALKTTKDTEACIFFTLKHQWKSKSTFLCRKTTMIRGSEEIFQMNRMNIAFIEFYKQTS